MYPCHMLEKMIFKSDITVRLDGALGTMKINLAISIVESKIQEFFFKKNEQRLS
jgi:hypothetical protein